MILLFLNLDMVPWNSAPGGFAYISQSKWVGIIAIKTRESKSFFLRDVLSALALLNLKVPVITYKTLPQSLGRPIVLTYTCHSCYKNRLMKSINKKFTGVKHPRLHSHMVAPVSPLLKHAT